MYPTSISDEELSRFPMPRARKVIAPEDDDLFNAIVAPAEAVITQVPLEFPNQEAVQFYFRIRLTEEDIKSINDNGYFYMSQMGQAVTPFSFYRAEEI